MDQEPIKPAGLPSAEPVATPPPSADPMLAPQNQAPEEKPAEEKEEPKEKKEDKKQPEPFKAKKPSNNQSVAVAIIATIIIVLGIAALAVYAYLKQH